MAAGAALLRGQLVEIVGLKGPANTPEEWRGAGAGYEGPIEANGLRGQLAEWDDGNGHWIVATFGATFVAIQEAFLRPLTSSEVEDFDLALGPASDADVMGEELASRLASNGHALCKLFVSPEDLDLLVQTAEKCVAAGMFSRLASELEPGYLGKECIGKTFAFDPEDDDLPDLIKESPISLVEDALALVGQLLQPVVEEQFDFSLYSRSNTMLSLPFEGDEETDFLPPDLENEDAAAFLSMMWRAKLHVIANVGPGTAQVTLLPKSAGDKEAVLEVQPGMMAIFLVERFRFACAKESKALTASCWYLDVPKEYVIADLEGDLSSLGMGVSGPPVPKPADPIAVVATGTRYAFGVDEAWKLWCAYGKGGFDSFIRHPFMRWDIDIYYRPDAEAGTGLSYTCHGGFSEGIELFDPKFFDISTWEARSMDPTQRQVLEVMYMSLHGGGFTKKMLQQKPANICGFVGLDKNEWNSMPKDGGAGFGATSSANAITSNRFNYCMNLRGASMTIDTACSASLVCTHTGKLYLLAKHYDPCVACITCGVNLLLSFGSFIGCCSAGMLSHLGRSFTYNFSADGYARGESTASHCMKPKPWAREDGDLVMLTGSQANQDGRSASLTAPNGPAQERCARAVMKEAGTRAPEIDSCECHGTGTSLGDPIEIGAYRKVMTEVPRYEPVAITCSKSNIGHCEGSAGIGGFLKIVLLGMHSECSPNMHLNCLNPHLDMEGFPSLITSENITLRADATFNSVLSFGFGGTNASAQVYGQNYVTTRGTFKGDVYKKLLQKIQAAPAQDVFLAGEDWEDWEMEGPEKDARPGDTWEIEIDEDGTVSFDRKEKEVLDLGDEVYITGTFNDWSYTLLEPDDQIVGLHTAIVEIGSSGEELFQILCDQDPNRVLYPGAERCVVKSTSLMGPGKPPDRSFAWCIRAKAGDAYRVELFRSEASAVSVNWVREV